MIFSLAPPVQRGGAWTETVLHAFAGYAASPCDGYRPLGTLVQDAGGVHYGFTRFGGANANGVAYAISRDASGIWRKQVIYVFPFAPPFTTQSYAGPVLDAAANLVGSSVFRGASGAGDVFKLIRPAGGTGSWTYTLLHDSPACSMAANRIPTSSWR